MIDNKCFVEVFEVLKNFNIFLRAKIPKDVLEDIKEKANQEINYKVNLDKNRPLEVQISREALAILTCLMLKYVVNEEQKRKLKISLTKNQAKYELSKKIYKK